MSNNDHQPRQANPGVSRDDRLSEEGLQRLEKQLASGVAISQLVLQQWVKRYGQSAIDLLERYGKSVDS